MSSERNRTDDDGLVLSRISNEVVQAHKASLGRGPVKARTYLHEDVCIVVLKDGLTTSEETMVAAGRSDLVRQSRDVLEHSLCTAFVPRLEELTGKPVLNHSAQIVFEPHVVVLAFLLDD